LVELTREPHALKEAKPRYVLSLTLVCSFVPVRLIIERYDVPRISPSDQRAIYFCELIARDDSCPRFQNVALYPETQLAARDLLAPVPDPRLDVVAVNRKRAARFGDAANQNVYVRIVGVVMIDRRPLKARSEIEFHLGDQLACMLFEIHYGAERQRERDETKFANELHGDRLLTPLLGPIELRDIEAERIL
jgi:hypothetical protein